MKQVESLKEIPSLNSRRLDVAPQGKTLIMGVLNVTPDSFSDGGVFLPKDKAVDHALRMASQAADFIDIGGESSRPFSGSVSVHEELERVIPVIEVLREKTNSLISIDTTKSLVARQAVAAGAALINDISALRFDEEMAATVAELDVPVVLMHMKGTPRNMQVDPTYSNLMDEVKAFFEERMQYAVARGIPENHIILDPGIGFGKTFDHNVQILHRLKELTSLGRPVLIGTSRKAFLGKITGVTQADQRDIGTAASLAIGVYNGARIVRVHNVEVARQTVAVVEAIKHETVDPS